LVAWSLETFGALAEIGDLVVATEGDLIDPMRELIARFAGRLVSRVVAGGATRQASVAAALAAVPERCDAVFVHDGARPLVQPQDVRAGLAAVGPGVGALLAAPVIDTIKQVDGDGRVLATLERAHLWAAQTPQFAMLAELRAAHAQAARDGHLATDDVALLERSGTRVVVVRASGPNFKVTVPADRDLAEAILRERATVRA
ncbi:MAG: IspD/TarI family cytidylyltransferase, partial [Candidatus Dormibacteria bacterium]